MAWNEPGGNKPNDPWGGDNGPPDLDEAFRKFKEKFSGGSGKGPSGSDMPSFDGKIIAIIFAILAVLYVAVGFYTVDAQERAVVLRLGKYHDTVNPGLQFNWPLIDKVYKVNTTRTRSIRIRELMLTEDENIVQVSVSVQYTIMDPKSFILEVRDPERSLQHAAESALRHVVGSAELHQVLTEGRKQVTIEVEERLQGYLDNYLTGIDVTTVSIEDAQPPTEVQAAFDDVIRAREDEQRVKNEAESYRNGIIPEARGFAQRQIEEANAYKEQVIAQAEGEAKRFDQLRKEYERAPKVTRERLYINTMEKVLENTSKVMVDVDGGNLMYLPLDKLMSNNGQASGGSANFDFSTLGRKASDSQSQRSSGRSSTREAR
jgi:membrane protease subunit HflK